MMDSRVTFSRCDRLVAMMGLGACVVALSCGTVRAGTPFYLVNFYGATGSYDSDSGAAIGSKLGSTTTEATGLAVDSNRLYLADVQSSYIAEFNATTGATINSKLISFNTPDGIFIDGNTLYTESVVGGTIGVFDANTGAAINSTLVSGLYRPGQVVKFGNTLFVTTSNNPNTGESGVVGAYDATTGATINTNFITGLDNPTGMAVYGNNLYVLNDYEQVAVYDARTGALINPALVSENEGRGFNIAVGDGKILLANFDNSKVQSFDLNTGQLINDDLVNSTYAWNVAFQTYTGVPEPASLGLIGAGSVLLMGRRRRPTAS